ncbi:MAG: YceI family protein [Lewinellaceae bacterium]|nr:YceI family protein [Lewinellaceae bacterium]
MKNKLFLTILAALSTLSLLAQSSYQVASSNMSVSGTSTLHRWESAVTKVNIKGKISLEDGVLDAINTLEVSIPAKGIISTKGKVMDSKTWEALKADEHPNITFQLTGIESLQRNGSSYNIKAKGNLTIAGAKKPVTLNVTGTVASDGKVTFKGSKTITLMDYNITPPKAVMGTIKVGEEVTINFEVTLASVS